MEDHLLNKDRLEQEWKELEAYQPDVTAANVASEGKNKPKNRNAEVVPCKRLSNMSLPWSVQNPFLDDHNRVILNEGSNATGSNYINASFIVSALGGGGEMCWKGIIRVFWCFSAIMILAIHRTLRVKRRSLKRWPISGK